MKVFVVIFSLFLIGNAKGDILADAWKKSAADVGPIDMEPGLDGNDLFQSLLRDIGTFMEAYETVIDQQFNQRIGFYGDSTYYGSITLREAVSHADDSTPANAFDNFMIQHTGFLTQFIAEIKEYLGVSKGIKRVQDTKEERIQPRLANRGLSDFLVHLDRILKTDFSLLSSYVDDMISMGKQGIFEHYKEIIAKYEGRLPTIYSMMKGYLTNAEMYKDALTKHTSEYVLMNFNNAKDEILRIIPNV